MRKNYSRRKFLHASSLALGGILTANSIKLDAKSYMVNPSKNVAPSDTIRFAMIGVGMQGSGLLTDAITLPGAECVRTAELYDGRNTLAKEITGNPNLFTARHYRELLDRKNIDCITAAVSDHWHKRVVVYACNAGKDIYCKKPMSHKTPEGFEMIDAVRKNNRIVQIGSQRVSSNLCEKARELYNDEAIGDVENVELSLGRNDPTGTWEYPPPTDLSP